MSFAVTLQYNPPCKCPSIQKQKKKKMEKFDIKSQTLTSERLWQILQNMILLCSHIKCNVTWLSWNSNRARHVNALFSSALLIVPFNWTWTKELNKFYGISSFCRFNMAGLFWCSFFKTISQLFSFILFFFLFFSFDYEIIKHVI